MNTASCAICKDAYTQSSILIATPCGHIYHQDCISRCMASTSRVCPMCRKTLRQDKLLRLYFDFDRNRSIVDDSADVDVSELQRTLADLRTQLTLSESRCLEAEHNVVQQTNSLEKECAIAASLRDQLEDLRQSERLLRAEFKRSQENLRNALASTHDAEALRRELDQLSDLRRVVRGKEDDVRAMIEERSHSSDALRELCIWTCILKEEREALKKDRKLKTEDCSRLNKRLKAVEADLAAALSQVQKSELSVKEVLQENVSLKRRLNKFVLAHESAKKRKAQSNLQMTPDVTDGFLRRMINESPFPADVVLRRGSDNCKATAVVAPSIASKALLHNVSGIDLFERSYEESGDTTLSKSQDRQHVKQQTPSLTLDNNYQSLCKQTIAPSESVQSVTTPSLSWNQPSIERGNRLKRSCSTDTAHENVKQSASLTVDLTTPPQSENRRVRKPTATLTVDLTSTDNISQANSSFSRSITTSHVLSILQPRVLGCSSFMHAGYDGFGGRVKEHPNPRNCITSIALKRSKSVASTKTKSSLNAKSGVKQARLSTFFKKQ